MPALTRDEVLRIAALARLDLTHEDAERFTGQLARILAFADAVVRADTGDVPPTAAVFAAGPAWRDDAPGEPLARDAVLADAPAAEPGAGLFTVPRVI